MVQKAADTIARADLPGLVIEVYHRRDAEGGAESLALSLRAAPSFRAASDSLAFATSMLALPLLGWATLWNTARLLWSPFLPPGEDTARRGALPPR